MKQHNLRILSLLMIIAIALTLTACSSGNTSTTASSVSQTSTQQGSTQVTGTTANSDNPWAGLDLTKHETINTYVIGVQGTDWDKITQMAIKKIEDKINTTVKFVHVPWSDFQAKYTLFLAADSDVDIIYGASWCNFSEYVHSGAFKDFDMEFVKKYMPLTAEKQEKASWNEPVFNGKLYGIPHNKASIGASGVITTQDILDKYNFKAADIKDFDSLGKFLTTVAAGSKKDGMYAINPQNAYPMDAFYLGYHMYGMDAGNVNWMLYPSSKTDTVFDANNLQWFATTDTYKKFCLQMAEFNKAGVFPANVMSNATMIDANFSEGKSAINFSDPYGASNARASLKAKGKDVVYLDCLFDDQSVTMRGSFMGYAAAFPASSKKMERAATALDCMKFDPEINRLLVGGIEGEHYILDKANNKRELGPNAAAYPWNGWFYLLENQSDPDLKIDADLQTYQDRYLKAEVSRDNFPVVGFSYNNSKYQAEIAVLSSLFNEYRFSFCFGIFQDKTEAKLNDFIKKCKDAGIDKIVDDYKAQVKTFVESQKK